MLARTGLVTYSGPHWSSLGMRDHLEDTLVWFRACVFRAEAGGAGGEPIELGAARTWSDDPWFLDQDDRYVEPNTGWWVLSDGTGAGVEGRLVGTNLSTLARLGAVVRTKPQLDAIPVVANLDFGHTTPLLTLPVGGTVRVEVDRGRARIVLLEH